MSSKFKPNTTQTPNSIFDSIMANLADNELRVLLVVIRKTYGWGKDVDMISNSQFEKMTGLEKRQIQRAKQSLKTKGLLRETGPAMLGGIPEYEFFEANPVTCTTPPRDMHDTPPVTSETSPPVSPVTPTKDTKNKRQYKQNTGGSSAQNDVNEFLKIIQEHTGMVLYGDFRLRSLIKRAIENDSRDYVKDVLTNYLNDDFMKSKKAWSFTNFFASKEKMERHKTRKILETQLKSTLPVYGAGEVWYG